MCFCLRSLNFYPRSPCGERRGGILKTISKRLISIHALLAESDPFTEHDVNSALISIHALLAESDWRTCAACTAKQYFYPRSPCVERLAYFQPHALSVLFLSTLSLRRATRFQCGAIQHNKDFYPRSPCGERPPYFSQPATLFKFLSTLSLRRATGIITTFAIIAGHFYPRSPCGERPSPCVVMNVRRDFYPRSPCGERRCQRGPGVPDLDFYPRSPCGERLQRQIEFERYSDISIHALLAESDAYCINDVRCIVISIHALLAESDATLT